MSGDQSMGGKAPTPPSRGAGAVRLENLTRLTTDTLTTRLEAMFASCDDYFFDLASRAKNNNDQNLYFESLREIRVKKPVVAPDFCRRLSAGFHILAQRSGGSAGMQATPVARTPESLELVGNEELEKDVVIIDMVSKARMEWQEELFQLCKHVLSCRLPLGSRRFLPCLADLGKVYEQSRDQLRDLCYRRSQSQFTRSQTVSKLRFGTRQSGIGKVRAIGN